MGATALGSASWKQSAPLIVALYASTIYFTVDEQLPVVIAFALSLVPVSAGTGAGVRRTVDAGSKLFRVRGFRVRPREADGRSSRGWIWQALIAVWCLAFSIAASASGLILGTVVLMAALAESSFFAGYLAYAHFKEQSATGDG